MGSEREPVLLRTNGDSAFAALRDETDSACGGAIRGMGDALCGGMIPRELPAAMPIRQSRLSSPFSNCPSLPDFYGAKSRKGGGGQPSTREIQALP